jgi:hemolysin III
MTSDLDSLDFSHSATSDPVKPKMRGWSHAAGAIVAIPATWLLASAAQPGDGTVGAIVYGLSMILLLGVSGTYHVFFWPEEIRAKIRLLDHSMIYVLLGGSYTPFCLMTGDWVSGVVLPVVWVMSLIGILRTLFVPNMRRWVKAFSYVAMGWISLPLVFKWHEALGTDVLAYLLGGGFVYTAGAFVYTQKVPNPWPKTFGYHEVFHVSVLIGCMAHYWAVWLAVT